MKIRNKHYLAFVAIFTILLSSFALPYSKAFASIDGEGEEKVKKFLYAYAAAECFKKASDSDLSTTISIGDKISNVIVPGRMGKVNTSELLGGAEITCEDAIKGLFGSEEVSASTLNNNGILNGAYSEETSTQYLLSCYYAIANAESTDGNETPMENSDNPGEVRLFQYPQGFTVENGEHKDYRSVAGMNFYFDDSGYLGKHDGGSSDANPNLDSAIASQWVSNTNLEDTCMHIISNVNIYPNAAGGYDPVYAWGGALSVILDKDDVHFKAVKTQAQNGGGYVLQKNAGNTIAENINKYYFNGLGAEQYFNSNKDIAYIYYGRYLYNGDGRFSKGCGGISVATDDEDIDELKGNQYWESNLSYITTTNAYESTGDSKKEYFTKLGASNSKDAGKVNSVKLYPWSTSTTSCTEIADKFNDISLSGALTAKAAVASYVNAISAEAALSGTVPTNSGNSSSNGSFSGGLGDTSAAINGTPLTKAAGQDTDCQTNTGSLGWLVCPIIDGVQNFITEQYAEFIGPALQIDVGLFSTSTDGTYTAWNIFRTIANMAFVILFVIVIFSQLTGVGINNYGIKKIFPKLIVAAILINLSYIICQIAIDLANIAGRSIGTLFEGITKSLQEINSVHVDLGNGNSADVGSQAWIGGIPEGGWQAIVLIVVTVIASAAVLTQGWAIVIPVLIGLLGILIAVLGLICILGIRQAACVLLVAASPLAFACYMLPNTQPIFKKWSKAFSTLLMAFPICSALVYGGDMVSHILLQSANGSFWIILSSAAVGIAPIFFIPKIISSSLGAISGGVMRMTGKLGGKAKGAAQKRLDNSWLTNKRNYRQNLRAQKAAAQKSEYNAKRSRGVLKKYADKDDLGTFERRRYNAALGIVNADEAEQEKIEASKFANMSQEQRANALIAAAQSGKLSNAKLMAGINSIKDEGQLTRAMYEMRDSNAFREIMKDNRMRGKVGGALAARSGSIINQSMGQLIQDGVSTEEMFSNHGQKLADKVQEADDDVLSRQSETTFNTEIKDNEGKTVFDLGNFMSARQMAGGIKAHLTGSAGSNFNRHLSSYGSRAGQTGTKDDVIRAISASHLGGATMDNVTALGGAKHISDVNPNAVHSFNSAEGAGYRAGADAGVVGSMGALGSH